MDFQQFLRPTALLFREPPENLEELLQAGWQIVDADLFLENLPLWGGSAQPIASLFGHPRPGIRQNLANTREKRVGLIGTWLTGNSLAQIIEEYRTRGYDVVVYDSSGKVIFHPSEPSKVCRIIFNTPK